MSGMYTPFITDWRTGLGAGLLLTLQGCSHQPLDYPERDEIMPGPGFLTGEEGEFKIYSNEDANDASGKESASPKSNFDPDEFREFQAYQAWKRNKKHSKEYQEWLEWKAYQEWKSQQGPSKK